MRLKTYDPGGKDMNCESCVWHIPCSETCICSCEDSERYGEEIEGTYACERFHGIEKLEGEGT